MGVMRVVSDNVLQILFCVILKSAHHVDFAHSLITVLYMLHMRSLNAKTHGTDTQTKKRA